MRAALTMLGRMPRPIAPSIWMTDGIGGVIHQDQDHKQRKATPLQGSGRITWIEWEGKKRDMVRPERFELPT